MTLEINRDNIQDLIIQGTKEAIDLELLRLRNDSPSQDAPSDLSGKIKKPFAGLWALICSVACVTLFFPIAGAASGIVVHLYHKGYFVPKMYDDVGLGWNTVFYTLFVMTTLGLLFLVLGIIIGGKYTRILCAIFTFIVFLIIFLAVASIIIFRVRTFCCFI